MLAHEQVLLLKAETDAQAIAHSRYADALRAIKKAVADTAQLVDRLELAAGSEAVAISARASQLESEVKHFEALNKALGVVK